MFKDYIERIKGIANAHWITKNWEFIGFRAWNGDIIQKEEVERAKVKLEKLKKEEEKEAKEKNLIIFSEMGMNFKAQDGFIWCHRIRANFYDNDGVKCFIEVWPKADKNLMRCDYAIYDYDNKKIYNYKNLETIINESKLEYTNKDLLIMINSYFNCDYSGILISSII